MKNYPGVSWSAESPFNVVEGAIGWLIVDARSDLIIAGMRYGSEYNRAMIYDLATVLNYGKLGISGAVLRATDLTA